MARESDKVTFKKALETYEDYVFQNYNASMYTEEYIKIKEIALDKAAEVIAKHRDIWVR